MLRITLSGRDVVLLTSGAAWLTAEATLLVADAHIGKAASFRRLGVPAPRGTTSETLDKLTADLAHTDAGHVVFLGDLLHSARGRTTATLATLAHWREQHPGVRVTLVRGNHDRRAGDPPAHLGFEVVREPFVHGGFALCHHPRAVPDAYVLAGYWHPCVHLAGQAFERLRLPCFWFGDDSGLLPTRAVGVLPAFGSFTGMHRIEPQAGDRIFPIAGDTVRAVPVRATR